MQVEVDQVLQWKQAETTNKQGVTEYFLVLNLHYLDQRVWGDFKVDFKSKDCNFYFWLNVSAILYNNDLRKITEREGITEPERSIHFEEFQELEETDFSTNQLG